MSLRSEIAKRRFARMKRALGQVTADDEQIELHRENTDLHHEHVALLRRYWARAQVREDSNTVNIELIARRLCTPWWRRLFGKETR